MMRPERIHYAGSNMRLRQLRGSIVLDGAKERVAGPLTFWILVNDELQSQQEG